MTPKQRKQAAEKLRGIANAVESGNFPLLVFSEIAHMQDVTRPETGPMVVDARYLGTTVVISSLPFDRAAGEQIRNAIERSCGIIR